MLVDLYFFIAFVLFVPLWKFLPRAELLSKLTLIASSAVFLSAFGDLRVKQIGFLFGSALAVYFLCIFICSSKLSESKKRNLILFLLLGIGGLLLASKTPRFQLRPSSVFPFIGFSFVALKFYHFCADYRKGVSSVQNPYRISSILDFFAYISFFPVFISGPIPKFQDFTKDFRHPRYPGDSEAGAMLSRIAIGLFKKLFLVSALEPFALHGHDALDATGLGLVFKAVTYSFLIYFDFSGYSDIAIGASAFLGFSMPENFKNPYLKRNLIEFWNSWHISFSNWLRTYIFMPLGQGLFRTKLRSMPLLIASTAYLITFLFCGFWHGWGANFMFWGIYHGVGLALTKAFLTLFKRHCPSFEVRVAKSGFAALISTLATFAFVTLGWIFFVFDVSELYLLKQRLLGYL